MREQSGRTIVNTAHPSSWVAFENHTTAQTDNPIKGTPGAGYRLVITDIILSNGATAGTIKLVENTASASDISATYYFAINGGMAMPMSGVIRLSENVDLGFTSATVTTHTITVLGYTEKMP